MANIFWETPAGNLGTYAAGTYYSLTLQVFNPTDVPTTYQAISGALPPGLQVMPGGVLQGVPTVITAVTLAQTEEYYFSIRATVGNQVIDRTFSMGITNITPPTITPSYSNLGTVFDGAFYSEQLEAIEVDDSIVLSWSVNSGALPPGVSLNSSTGLISGFVTPVLLNSAYGPVGYDGETITSGVVVQEQDYDTPPFDFIGTPTTTNYKWTVEVTNGEESALQQYVLNVVSKGDWTADTDDTGVNDTYLTVDHDNVYVPVILTPPESLPLGRAGSNYAFQFTGTDFQANNILYNLYGVVTGSFDSNGDDINHQFGVGFDYSPFDENSAGSLASLPGLTLDITTGWLFGNITPLAASLSTFEFEVYASKLVGNVTYESAPVLFTLPIAGEINNIVEWVTPENLGEITNGTISDLSVVAKHLAGKQLEYSIVDLPSSALPQGLTLLPSGDLSGRTSFEFFTLDNNALTFDNNATQFDNSFTFSVQAITFDGSASAIKQFTITVNNYNKKPYEDLYLKALLPAAQRASFAQLINNTEIFVPDIIYRSTDPWFGIQQDIKMLFLSGLNPASLNSYQAAMELNHYNKTLSFGPVQTAVCLDNNFNVKYELVYLTVVDPEENAAGKGPAANLSVTSTTVVHPNSLQNMADNIIANIGYANQGALPDWMASNQIDPSDPSKFLVPLGLINAVVLAYTLPGKSQLLAYRLNNSNINFSNYNFTVDRYLLDNTLSANYDITANAFVLGKQTTFDFGATPPASLVGNVNYALTNTTFANINARPVEYVQANGGLDGVTNFSTGQQLIFAQQENFVTSVPNDGWVAFQDGFIGDNIVASNNVGYGAEAFDYFSPVPGYVDKQQNIANVNQQGGIWEITISNNTVFLDFVLEVEINQEIKIISGEKYAGQTMYYNPTPVGGQTVPSYSVVTQVGLIANTETTFDGDGTRFFDYRDNYYTPESDDKYLKFPQTGVFI